MSDANLRRSHVAENGSSTFSVNIEVSGHQIIGDEPEADGGHNLGPAPFDILLAALGECTVMTVRWYAQQQKWPLERVEAKLTHQKMDKKDYFTKEIILHGNSLTTEQRAKLIEVAAKCPVQRTLEGTPSIQTG